jgi:Fungal Zn(2)-Cys(6) binuclear cluster domain
MKAPLAPPIVAAQVASTGSIKRSRSGCWTCRARKRKCDERKPTCMQCTEKNLHCSGYSRRLIWINGIASRGYLAGKTYSATRVSQEMVASEQPEIQYSRKYVDEILLRDCIYPFYYLSYAMKAALLTEQIQLKVMVIPRYPRLKTLGGTNSSYT